MCGKDGAQRRVYKLKEEHERGGDQNRKRKKRKRDVDKKEESEKKREGVALVNREKHSLYHL